LESGQKQKSGQWVNSDKKETMLNSSATAKLPALASCIKRSDPGFPLALEALEEPPAELHVAGQLPSGPTAAFVGSRDADEDAVRFIMRTASDLALRGFTIVSGGARGVDTAAHRGALEAGGTTVVVLGAGMNFPYPAENEPLYHRIINEGGAVISEFEHETPPARWTFPRRNRIIAALSQAVIVGPASSRSGALITAREAGRIGRPVGAVPMHPDDPLSAGPNGLIRTGAAVIESIEDVFKLTGQRVKGGQLRLPGIAVKEPPEGSDESRVFSLIGSKPVHIDDVMQNADLSPSAVSAALVQLELAGLVEQHQGKRFCRK